MQNKEYTEIQELLSEFHLWTNDHNETQDIIDRVMRQIDILRSRVVYDKKLDKMMDLSDVIDIKF